MQLRDTNQGSARLSDRGRRMELLLTVAIMRRKRGRAKDNMQIGGVHGISDRRDRPIGRPLTSQSTKDRRRSSADFKARLASEPPTGCGDHAMETDSSQRRRGKAFLSWESHHHFGSMRNRASGILRPCRERQSCRGAAFRQGVDQVTNTSHWQYQKVVPNALARSFWLRRNVTFRRTAWMRTLSSQIRIARIVPSRYRVKNPGRNEPGRLGETDCL